MAAVAFSQTFFAVGGGVAASCKAYTFERGTSTPKAVYTDVGLTTPATNPVIGSVLGVQLFYLDGDEDYSIHIKTSDDATSLMQIDYVADGAFFSIISYTIENVQFAEFDFTGDGSDTTFTLTSVLAPSSYSLWITIDGVYQPVSSYTVARVGADTVVTFLTAPPDDATIYVRLLSLQGQIGPKGDTGDVPAERTITAGAGLTGGGDLSANRTLAVDTPYQPGVQMIWIPASGMTLVDTNGAEAGTTESSSNKVMFSTLDFDASTQEYAQFDLSMPKGWDEGTFTAGFDWLGPGGTGNVIWGIQAVAISNDDPFDAAWGTAQEVTDGVTATTDLMKTDATSAVTIAGTPAEGDLVKFRVYRKAADGSDTLASDAKLVGVRLFLTFTAHNDA